MACPLCGDRCTCSFAPATPAAGAAAPSSLTYEYDDEYRPPEFINVTSDPAPPSSGVEAARESAWAVEPAPLPPEDLTLESVLDEPEPGPQWKQEVVSVLENYRSRRGTRRPRYNATMSLDFDRAVNRMVNTALAKEEVAMAAVEAAAAAEPESTPETERNEYFGATSDRPDPDSWSSLAPLEAPAEDPPAPEVKPQVATKVIEFPRLLTLFDNAPTGDELADPVVDKPRILYVPEEVPTAQAPLADIQIAPEERLPMPEVELPLRVAPMGHRVIAALADAVVVLAAAAIFMAVVLRQVPAPDSKLGYLLVAAVPAVFWAIYEYLFLVHCAATPGMQMAHLALASFDSEPIGRSLRRARALAAMLSTFPLGLGLVWALLDEDTLCWHDRITRTYLTIPTPEYDS